MYPNAIGRNVSVWTPSLITDRFMEMAIPPLRPCYDSGLRACKLSRAFASLIIMWNLVLQAVGRLCLQIVSILLRWIDVPYGFPPTTTPVITYAGPTGMLSVTNSTTPSVIIRSPSGNYHALGSDMTAFNPRVVSRQRDILLGHCNSKLFEQSLYRHQWIDRTELATDGHHEARFRRCSFPHPSSPLPPGDIDGIRNRKTDN